MEVRLLTSTAESIVRDLLTRSLEYTSDIPEGAFPSRPAFERGYVVVPDSTGDLALWRDVTQTPGGGGATLDGDAIVTALHTSGGRGAVLHNHPDAPQPSDQDLLFQAELSRRLGCTVPGIIFGHIVPFALAATEMVYCAQPPPRETEEAMYRGLFRAVGGLDPAGGELVPGPYGGTLAALYDAVGAPADDRTGFGTDMAAMPEERKAVVVQKLVSIYMRGSTRVAKAYVADEGAPDVYREVPLVLVHGAAFPDAPQISQS